MLVRRLSAAQWPLLRQVRLASLRDAPEAFGGTLERSLSYDQETWERLAAQRAVALVDDEPVGLVGWQPYDLDPEGMEVISVWVHPLWRGQGVLDRLTEVARSEAVAQGFSYLVLYAYVENLPARRAYERLGFTVVSETEHHGKRSFCMRRLLA